MKYIIPVLLIFMSLSAQSGDVLYSAGFTKSQRAMAEKCYLKDSTFPSQIDKLTSIGDISLHGMHHRKGGYMFMLRTNAYGSWMEYTPLYCDLRSEKEKAEEAALKARKIKQAKLAAKIKAKADAERKAQHEAAREEQLRDQKFEADKKAEAERIRREKYDPIANLCLKEAISLDFPEYLRTVRRPTGVGSNQTVTYKALRRKVKEYSVSEGTITIKYYYAPTLFYVSKRTGQEKQSSSERRNRTFKCDLDLTNNS